MARVKFTKDYLHKWPSRASTRFYAEGGPNKDGIYTVKKEVSVSAIAKGYATEVTERAKRPADEAAPRQDTGLVAGGDHAPDGDGAPRDELEPDGDAGGVPGVSIVPDA